MNVARFARAFALGVLLFPVALATHEVAHLAVFSALGIPASLVVTSWKLGSLGTPIWGLHAAPAAPLSLSALVLNNALGPLVAASLLLIVWASLDRRSRAARAALLANVLALVFFATIEMAYPLLEGVARVDADVLLLPELNYGTVLAILLATTAVAAGGGRRGRIPARPRSADTGSPDRRAASA